MSGQVCIQVYSVHVLVSAEHTAAKQTDQHGQQLTQYRNSEITHTEIQSAYKALLLGCRLVMEVCKTQLTQ